MLILAGVSIATLTGKNGILSKANIAKQQSNEEGIKEEVKIAYASVETDAIINGWDINKKAEELQKELRKGDKTATVTVDGTNLNITYKDIDLVIDQKGNITIGESSSIKINEFSIKGTKVINITPPTGFVHVGGTVDKGYVISDDPSDENKGVDADLAGNQFVWIPVEKDQKITATVTSEENIASLAITDPRGDDIVTETNVGKEYNKQIEPTINGLYRIVVKTESGDEKKKLLNVHSLYAVDSFAGWRLDKIVQELGFDNIQSMLEETGLKTVEEVIYELGNGYEYELEEEEDYKEKVNQNGGFYIGRYEAGDSSATSDRTSERAGTLVTKKNQFVYNYINHMDAVSKAKAYNTTLNSSLLTEAAWDRTMGWLYETGAKNEVELVIDSTSWGNYRNDTFSNTEGLIKTGIFRETQANNIYDLAGNVTEYTTTYYSSGDYVLRGGSYEESGSGFPASDYTNLTPGYYNFDNIGFRIALYL